MRILFLTHRLPYAPNRGDRIRAYHALHVLRERAHVDLLSLVHSADEAAHAAALVGVVDSLHLAPVARIRSLAAAASSLGTELPLTHALLDSPSALPLLRQIVAERRPDVVLAYCSGMARFALTPPLEGLPFVVDLVDVDSLKWRSYAEAGSGPARWIFRREARSLSSFEASVARRAFATVVVNEREAAAMRAVAAGARIEVVRNGVAYEDLRPPTPPADSSDVVFCGVMNYRPNEEAALWLAREIWPRVRQRTSNARLCLVGSAPTRRLKSLAADPTIKVTGDVPDVRPYLWNAAVAVAPLRTARGVQNKVLEAAAAGLPAVVTDVVADGLPAEILRACRVARTPADFADAIVAYLSLSPAARRAVATAVDLTPLSWSKQLAPLADLLQAASHDARPRSVAAAAIRR